MNELQNILQAFTHSQESGQRTALATVVQTSGSVYRRPGARMLLVEDGQMISAISGGCLEGDVFERSQLLMFEGGKPMLVRYDTTSGEDIVFGFGLGCNGVVDVLIESLGDETAVSQMSFIQDCLQSGQVGAIATVFRIEGASDLTVGSRLMLKWDGTVINGIANADIAQRIETDAHQTLRKKQTRVQSYTLKQGRVDVLIEVIQPLVPLLVFGSGYDAVPVVQLAKYLGWHVTVIDDRPGFLNGDRFPQADQILLCEPDNPDSYQHLLTPQTVAVVMTHRYLSDLAFLKTLIPSPVRYVGVLGPKRRMQQLSDDLAQDNILPTVGQKQRTYNPVGLDIAAETPQEIALSIVAEIQAVISGRCGGFLRDRVGSIHSPLEQPCLTLVS
ncbi:XdhC family protein [Nostoc sp. FACHB-152]|uniref:XdhC family protein n=1 Tax=unclassified Nostoc TaxID=2593658 RepID=UPI001682C9E4|nr:MULTISPECIES: XdhC/CoxI family protein [unclassified Nostoc]MBD2449961.1 XdhC family protein [Nostoc sp. FACHB-152]MBD2468447.1 XdhC family protein [Nostoc sp. FACHB-145]